MDLDAEGPPRDPGLASERTALAWNRSGLAVLAVVAIILRRLWPLHVEREVVALTILAVGAIVWALGMLLASRSQNAPGSTGLLSASNGRILTTGTLVLAVAGFLVSLFVLP
jgi:uncharacterized membrane protein YidH (DUF202 family)